MRIRKPHSIPVPDEYGTAYPILESGPFWHASKNRTYRESVTTRLRSLHEFLMSHELYIADRMSFAEPPEFKIRREELTERGLEFVWRYLDGYLEHLDRTQKVHNPEYLEACWKHLQESR